MGFPAIWGSGTRFPVPMFQHRAGSCAARVTSATLLGDEMIKTSMETVLACRSLPSLPAVAVEVLEATRDPNLSLGKLVKIVKADVALASKLLKVVNSSYYGLAKPCATIDRAVMMLGISPLKSLVLGFSLVDQTKGIKGTGLNTDVYWRRVLLSAAGAREVASRTKAADPEEAFTCALFQDIGVLACFQALGEGYAKLLAGEACEHDGDVGRERASLGFDHAEVGHELAVRWKLPESIATAIRYHHVPDEAPESVRPITRCVRAGALAAKVLAATLPGQNVAEFLFASTAWFGVDAEQLEPLFDSVQKVTADLASIFDRRVGPTVEISAILAAAEEARLNIQMDTQREADHFRAQATTDGLTGLANRATFDRAVGEAFSGGGELGLVFIDGDRFKTVNDTHGHAAGDAVLVELGRRIRGAVGEAGLVCRYGGEEIAVVLPGHGVARAAEVGERARAAVAATPMDLSAVAGRVLMLPVTISVGVSARDAGEASRLTGVGVLVAEADAAVYRSKRDGRNRVTVHKPGEGAESSSLSEAGAGGVEILLVEDDPLAAALVKSLVGKVAGARLIHASTVAEAVAAVGSVGKPAPGIVLTDMHLPDGDGLAVLRACRAMPRLAGTKMAVYSATIDESVARACVAAGACEVIDKRELVKDVAGCLQRLMAAQAPGAAAA